MPVDINVLINAAASLAQLITLAVESIKASTTLSEEQQKALLDKVEAELDAVRAAVTSVTYKR